MRLSGFFKGNHYRMTLANKLLIILLSIGALLTYTSDAYAIGEFSMGINAGITRDPNDLENEINSQNAWMEAQKEADPGAKTTQLTVPYAFVPGFNFRYQFNYLLLRIGGHFAKSGSGVKGSYVSSTGAKNTIRIQTYQNSFPLSLGFIVPLKERTYFYMGAGITFHQAFVKITQSNPSVPAYNSFGLNTKNIYLDNFVGFHLIVGTEAPLTDRITITAEWIHQEGRSHPIKNEGLDQNGLETTQPERIISARGDFILFGVNYYITM